MKPNVETTTFVFDPRKLDDETLDDLEADLADLNEEGWYIAATFPTGLIILEREATRVKAYTGGGTRRKRPHFHKPVENNEHLNNG